MQWLPESARFDMARGQTDRAFETLKRIAADNKKPMPLGRLVMDTSSQVRCCLMPVVSWHRYQPCTTNLDYIHDIVVFNLFFLPIKSLILGMK